MADDRTDHQQVVVDSLRQGFGNPGLGIGGVRQLAGGAMHQWWSADVDTSPPTPVVLRLAPAARLDAQKARNEFAVIGAAQARGVRVAKPIYVGENAASQTFMVSERMEGDTNPRQLLLAPEYETARARIIGQLAEDLAKVHTIGADEVDVPLRRPAPGEDGLLFELSYQVAEYQRVRLNPHPLLEWAFRWVRRRAEAMRVEVRHPHVVHGDFRIGNIMYDSQGLVAILDWEGTHLGEAEEDLAWFCTRVWRFNRRDLAAGGIADREVWVRAYERASGKEVDRERLKLWEVLQNIRWSVICMMQASQHLTAIMDSHEHAAIGRRSADTELEIMRLVGAVH